MVRTPTIDELARLIDGVDKSVEILTKTDDLLETLRTKNDFEKDEDEDEDEEDEENEEGSFFDIFR